jgi:biopolymer transport protein ExbD
MWVSGDRNPLCNFLIVKTKNMSKRKIPEVNAGSMADIAFLLLIFFLVTTTMDVDSGILRKLPAWNPDVQNPDKVKERNVLPVLINKQNQLAVNGELMDAIALTEEVKHFFLNPANAEDLPEKRVVEVAFFGNVEVSKGVVSLQNDRGTEYGKYIEVQNAIVRAFDEMRDDVAVAKFGKKLNDLPEDKQDAVREIIPLAISEAEPKNIK